jgi:hypothetical protein
LLAGTYTITGPSAFGARALSSLLWAAAVLVLGMVGHRLSGSRAVAVATGVLAAATPWLFEVGRLVFEVALEPLLISVLLLLLAQARGAPGWGLGRCCAIGVTLALIAYAYAGGRALAPLLALALLVYARGAMRRSVILTLGAFAVALLPMAAFVASNPRALLARFAQVNDAQDSSLWGTLVSATRNGVVELNLLQWAAKGDDNLRHHVQGTGSLLFGGVLLALVGVVVLLRGQRWEPYWSYVILGVLASAVPAAISDARLHALRSVGLPVFLIVLAVPALTALRAQAGDRQAAAAAVGVAALVLGQAAVFGTYYVEHGGARREAFHADLPQVLRAALQGAPGPVAVYVDDPDALGGVTWYAHAWGVPVNVLQDDASPRLGQAVVTVERTCAGCPVLKRGGMFTAYRTQ